MWKVDKIKLKKYKLINNKYNKSMFKICIKVTNYSHLWLKMLNFPKIVLRQILLDALK